MRILPWSLALILVVPVPSSAENPKPGDPNFDPFADYNLASRAPAPVPPTMPDPAPAKKEPQTAKLITLDVTVEPTTVKRGEVMKLIIRGTPAEKYWTYPLTMRAPEQKSGQLSKLVFDKEQPFKPFGTPQETEGEFALAGENVELKHKKPFTWPQNLFVAEEASPGKTYLEFSLKLQVCDDKHCLVGTHEFSIPVTISDAPPVPVSDSLKAELTRTAEITIKNPPAELAKQAPSETADDSGLLGFVLQGVIWGAISLLTPCVFPMIPITVSFFLKQSEREGHRPLLSATVYSLTIVIVLTIAAVALLSIFRAAINYWFTQYIMGALFVFFALSLFGMYEIELPSGLAQFTSRHEGSGLVGTVFMALTFTILSFACVAPFLGGFGGTATTAEMSFIKILMGGLAFSLTFASPFMVLALFPTLLRTMPKSGTWLNSVKVVMGFVELAAALKFFRAGERLVTSQQATFLTFNLVLALYVAICVLCALYLLGTYRLPHDSPTENIGVIRMLVGVAFLGLGLYLAPGMLQADEEGNTQRPRGAVYAWISSFILSDNESKEKWIPTLDEGLALARKNPGSRIFIDFTGVNCTNCNINEDNIFPMPEVQNELRKYVLVKLYTDTVPAQYYGPDDRNNKDKHEEDAYRNLELQRKHFGTEQLPLYAVVQPADNERGWETVAVYPEGKINDVSGFVRFLNKNAGTSPK